jgi:hypothetical protein
LRQSTLDVRYMAMWTAQPFLLAGSFKNTLYFGYAEHF